MRLKFYATYIANDGSIDTEEAESTVSDLAKNDENGILVVSTSADMDNYPFDEIGYLSSCYAAYDGFSNFRDMVLENPNDYYRLDCFLFMFAEFENGYDDAVRDKAAAGLALCFNSRNDTYKAEKYDGPEPIFDITVENEDSGNELHYRYHAFKNEENGKWDSEEMDAK